MSVPMKVLAAIAGGVLILLLCVQAASADDAAAGRKLAKQWCSSCHLVGTDQATASDVAPSFLEIAKDPTKTRAGLEVWLADPHPPMPNLNLTNREIDILITYIKSLGDGS